jgi:hypothetical protein
MQLFAASPEDHTEVRRTVDKPPSPLVETEEEEEDLFSSAADMLDSTPSQGDFTPRSIRRRDDSDSA